MNTSLTSVTRKDFFEYWKSIDNAKVKTDIELMSALHSLDQYSRMSNSGYSITNRVEMRFERVNLNFIRPYSKHFAENYIKQGYQYSFDQMRKDYLEFNFQTYLRLIDKELKLYPFEKRPQFEAFLDMHYRLNPCDTHFYRILQHLKVLETDNENFPVLYINHITDISFLKKQDNSTLAIKSSEGKINFFHFDGCSKRTIDNKIFSDRELSILGLLEKGFSSKQIADILFISPHTVDTHRSNMLEITNCINTTAMIIYCRMLGM